MMDAPPYAATFKLNGLRKDVGASVNRFADLSIINLVMANEVAIKPQVPVQLLKKPF